MKIRVHARKQMFKMRNSTSSLTLGVARYPKIGYNRLNIFGTYAEYGERKASRAAAREMFGPNFVRPSK
jgi:hypothetical protein